MATATIDKEPEVLFPSVNLKLDGEEVKLMLTLLERVKVDASELSELAHGIHGAIYDEVMGYVGDCDDNIPILVSKARIDLSKGYYAPSN